jgi:translation initiation factor IF-3
MGHPDAEPKLIGRNIHVMLTPLPVNKRKPKFHEPDEHRAEHEPANDHDENGREPSSDSNPPPARV